MIKQSKANLCSKHRIQNQIWSSFGTSNRSLLSGMQTSMSTFHTNRPFNILNRSCSLVSRPRFSGGAGPGYEANVHEKRCTYTRAILDSRSAEMLIFRNTILSGVYAKETWARKKVDEHITTRVLQSTESLQCSLMKCTVLSWKCSPGG